MSIKHTFDPASDSLPEAKTEFFQTETLKEYKTPIPTDPGMKASNDPTPFTYTSKPPSGLAKGTGHGK